VAQLGIVARLLAPSFAAAVLERRLLDPYGGWWRPQVGGAMPLALGDEALAGPVVTGDLATALHVHVVDEVVAPLVAYGTALSVSPQVLWGNVASAVNGAATMVAAVRPELTGAAAALATGLLSQGPLLGTSNVPGVAEVRFRRHSCCLLYRLSPREQRQVCGDCVLQV
jgi:ferric iron reductase protein FhuF